LTLNRYLFIIFLYFFSLQEKQSKQIASQTAVKLFGANRGANIAKLTAVRNATRTQPKSHAVPSPRLYFSTMANRCTACKMGPTATNSFFCGTMYAKFYLEMNKIEFFASSPAETAEAGDYRFRFLVVIHFVNR
jgi:hypothetical protein